MSSRHHHPDAREVPPRQAGHRQPSGEGSSHASGTPAGPVWQGQVLQVSANAAFIKHFCFAELPLGIRPAHASPKLRLKLQSRLGHPHCVLRPRSRLALQPALHGRSSRWVLALLLHRFSGFAELVRSRNTERQKHVAALGGHHVTVPAPACPAQRASLRWSKGRSTLSGIHQHHELTRQQRRMEQPSSEAIRTSHGQGPCVLLSQFQLPAQHFLFEVRPASMHDRLPMVKGRGNVGCNGIKGL